MKITSIKQQLKRQGRYSVFIDGKYSFSLSDTALLDSRLIVGQELSFTELEDLQQTALRDKLYNNVLNYIAIRPRSRWEIEAYLKRKDCPPHLAHSILNKLTNSNLIDDVSFARSWVASRRLLKATSRLRLQQELRAKHVPDEIANEILKNDETDEIAVLRELIMRKRKQLKYQNDQKLLQYLAGQGFRYGDIKTALSNTEE